MLLASDFHVARPPSSCWVLRLLWSPQHMLLEAFTACSSHQQHQAPFSVFSAGCSSLPDLGTGPRVQPRLLSSHPHRDPDHCLQDPLPPGMPSRHCFLKPDFIKQKNACAIQPSSMPVHKGNALGALVPRSGRKPPAPPDLTRG